MFVEVLQRSANRTVMLELQSAALEPQRNLVCLEIMSGGRP